jgi:hypothetical protein
MFLMCFLLSACVAKTSPFVGQWEGTRTIGTDSQPASVRIDIAPTATQDLLIILSPSCRAPAIEGDFVTVHRPTNVSECREFGISGGTANIQVETLYLSLSITLAGRAETARYVLTRPR